jgi:hypothetical protein
MNFSFGITTDYSDQNRLNEIISSIRSLQIPNYEILIIGGQKPEDKQDVNHIFFDESQKSGWVTRKKNTLAQAAKYDNVVIFHDYYVFEKDWYKNFLEFGDDWDVCSNAQYLITGKRHFTDWVVWDSPIFPRYTALNYDDWSHTKYMYQSGGYFIVKKQFMEKCPLNEDMMWGSAEDVEWSLRMREIANWKCNGKSIVTHNKVHRDA